MRDWKKEGWSATDWEKVQQETALAANLTTSFSSSVASGEGGFQPYHLALLAESFEALSRRMTALINPAIK